MSLDQNKIMLGLRVRITRGPYTGRTGTIIDLDYDDPEFRDYIEGVVIKWDKKCQIEGRKADTWWDFASLDVIAQPEDAPVIPARMQVGWKVLLWSMPRSKYHNKTAKIVKIARNSYFIVQWKDGKLTRWHWSLAPMFRGVPKPLSPRKAKKLEREALLAKFFYGA